MKVTIILFSCFVILSGIIARNPPQPISTCFTPPSAQCGNFIVNHINHAKQSIRIQAYGFTSEKIINALVLAKNRGVSIEIILDRSNFHRKKLDTIKLLRKHSIPVYQDNAKGIAHNKIMIIDNAKVITGSFNFTKNADYNNVENVVVLDDVNVASKYTKNWTERLSNSTIMYP
jgi:phospholipase D